MCSCHHQECNSGKCGCGCGCSSCSCSEHGCNCSCHGENSCHHHGHEDKYSHQLLELADKAWMEILKEKIKAEILVQSGDRLTELAKLIAGTNHKRWAAKMHAKKSCAEFESQLHAAMCCHDKECKK